MQKYINCREGTQKQLIAVGEKHPVNKCLLCNSDRTCSNDRPRPTSRNA